MAMLADPTVGRAIVRAFAGPLARLASKEKTAWRRAIDGS